LLLGKIITEGQSEVGVLCVLCVLRVLRAQLQELCDTVCVSHGVTQLYVIIPVGG
jgi:hypothetical protein